MTGFFRYPGGKAKLRGVIIKHLLHYACRFNVEYREPFFGGGSIGLHLFSKRAHTVSRAWINDKDAGIACLWTAVIRYPHRLKQLVRGFTPTIEAFDEYKAELLSLKNCPKQRKKVVDVGFKKLAIHQISYSGLGTKSGGPLGGRQQESAYDIGCRWSPDYICGKISRLNRLFARIEFRDDCCTAVDFAELLEKRGKAVFYLDPPYYVKGDELYQCSFTQDDHKRLCTALKQIKQPWLLSYDDCPQIRDLYDWAIVETVNVKYSITVAKEGGRNMSRTKPELLIYPESHEPIKRAMYEQPDLLA